MRERMCIVTRARADDQDLIRFVLDPDGQVVPDIKANLPGRGAWVTLDREVLGQAIKRKAFSRALQAETSIGGLDTLIDRTDMVLRQHALGALGFARKAGLVVNGFSKVESALKSGKTRLLLHAIEAAPDGQSKLNRLAQHVNVPLTQVFSRSELGLALGQEHVIHAALLDGPGAARFLAPIRRLEAFSLGKDTSDQTVRRTNDALRGDKTTV